MAPRISGGLHFWYLTKEQATDRKTQGSGGIAPPEPCVFSASLCLCFPCSDLLLHLLNQLGKLFLTLFLCFGIYILSHALSVDGRGVPSFPEVFVDLADTAGAGLAALPLVGEKLERN